MRQVQVLTVLALACLLGGGARGDEAKKDKIILDADVKAKKGLYPIAIPTPVASDSDVAKLITEVQAFDLGVSSWFSVLDSRSFLADLETEGLSIEPQKWKDVGAYGVIKAKATLSGGDVKLTFKLYEVDKGAVAVLEKEYSGPKSDARKLTHKWANDVVEYYTGETGFFGSQLTFSARGKKGSSKIYVMDFDGHGAYSVSKNESVNILPAWSPSGGKIAFTSYMRGTPDLYVTKAGGGRPVRLARYSGMNTGAAWSPDGSKIALTLSKDDNPEIYIIGASDGKVIKRLTNNRHIDTSPAWSPDGSEIAFVSNREGSPQIYVMNADGSNQRKVSSVGKFNQTPSWSPRKGARVIAYTARDDASGRYDIVTIDLANGNKMVRVTQGQGNNEEPTWSPNGRVLAFASSRSGGTGIYLANADGTGTQRLVYKGAATSPDWGPAP
jgi:TolB protein